MRLMGIDYGTKNIGIALSDEQGIYAFPHYVILNKGIKKTVNAIQKICGENKVGKIILGKSVNLKGQDNPIMEELEKFKNLLEQEICLPVEWQSEILTTQMARRGREIDASRGNIANPRRKTVSKNEHFDSSSAVLILQGFIDKTKKLS